MPLRKIVLLAGSIETKTAKVFAIDYPIKNVTNLRNSLFEPAHFVHEFIKCNVAAMPLIGFLVARPEYNDAAIMQLTGGGGGIST